jgi:hypothetical protein
MHEAVVVLAALAPPQDETMTAAGAEAEAFVLLDGNAAADRPSAGGPGRRLGRSPPTPLSTTGNASVTA